MSLTTDQQILIEQRVANEAPNVVVAYLLWLFLGLVSGHRFYLGKVGSALLQIASYFFLIGFIWWVMDGFSIPGMVRAKRDALRRQMSLSMGGVVPPSEVELIARGIGRTFRDARRRTVDTQTPSS